MNYKRVKFHKSISKVLSMRVDQSQILKNSEKNGLEPRTSQLDSIYTVTLYPTSKLFGSQCYCYYVSMSSHIP